MKRINFRTLFASRHNKIIAGVVAVLVLVIGFLVVRALGDKPEPETHQEAPQTITNKEELKEARDFLEDLGQEETQTTDDLAELDQQL